MSSRIQIRREVMVAHDHYEQILQDRGLDDKDRLYYRSKVETLQDVLRIIGRHPDISIEYPEARLP